MRSGGPTKREKDLSYCCEVFIVSFFLNDGKKTYQEGSTCVGDGRAEI